MGEREERNIRELEGCLLQLAMHASINATPICVDSARSILKDTLNRPAPTASVENVLYVVSAHYNLRVADLKSKRRVKNLTLPRHLAMYLARHLTNYSL